MIGVVGGTGGIGRRVVQGLVAAGAAPVAIVRDQSRARALLGDAVRCAVADMADAAAIRAALAGLRSLFLVSTVGTDMVALQSGVIQAARQAGVEHVVRISSIAVGDRSMNVQFARWHEQLDGLVESSGMCWTHLRPSNFMRNLLGFARGVQTTGELRAPLGDGRLCFVDDGDIAAVAVHALLQPEHRRRTYIVTGPAWQSYHDVAAIISEITERPVTYRAMGLDAARTAWSEAGHPGWFVDDLVAMYGCLAVATESPVTDHVARVTGRPPRPLRDFISEHAEAFSPRGLTS